QDEQQARRRCKQECKPCEHGSHGSSHPIREGSQVQGISIREFARREKCSDTLVRKAIKAGSLTMFSDGTLDPALVGDAWRGANSPANAGATSGGKARAG